MKTANRRVETRRAEQQAHAPGVASASSSTGPVAGTCPVRSSWRQRAREYVASGDYLWNAGIFCFAAGTVLEEMARHCPDILEVARACVRQAETARPGAGAPLELQGACFEKVPENSIDYALMEHASRVLAIEATFDWDDVGSWISIAKHLDTIPDNNRCNTPVTVVDSENNIVFSAENRRVALLGVDDLIVVQTHDALLIANRHQADDIRALVKELPAELL